MRFQIDELMYMVTNFGLWQKKGYVMLIGAVWGEETFGGIIDLIRLGNILGSSKDEMKDVATENDI